MTVQIFKNIPFHVMDNRLASSAPMIKDHVRMGCCAKCCTNRAHNHGTDPDLTSDRMLLGPPINRVPRLAAADAAVPVRIDAAHAVEFSVDTTARTLAGVLLPFGEVSRPASDSRTGMPARYTFAAGTVTVPDASEVVLNYGHDGQSLVSQIGVATSLAVKPDGIHARFRVARTPEGDRVLALADPSEGAPVLKSFSAEVEGSFEERDGVQHAITAALTGAAVVPRPAFIGAQITSVAASAAPESDAAARCAAASLLLC